MEFKTITISELPLFVKSELYKVTKNCPITIHRAISQSLNPRADKNDPAITVAVSNDNIVGYIGYLPDSINNTKVYWNSCWWVHDEYKTVAIPLLLQFIKTANEKIILTDLTPHTKKILSNLPFFTFTSLDSGFRGYLRFDFYNILPNKKPQFKSFRPFLKVIDFIANCFVFKKPKPFKLKVEKIQSFNQNDKAFLTSKNSKELIQRNVTEIEWIYNNPWVKNTNIDYCHYYFTASANGFNTSILRLLDNDRLVSIIYLKEQNNQLTVPYVYYKEGYLNELTKYIYNYAVEHKCFSITVFNPDLKKCLENDFSFITTRKLNRDFAFHQSLQQLIKNPVILQDGDGDVAFC